NRPRLQEAWWSPYVPTSIRFRETAICAGARSTQGLAHFPRSPPSSSLGLVLARGALLARGTLLARGPFAPHWALALAIGPARVLQAEAEWRLPRATQPAT